MEHFNLSTLAKDCGKLALFLKFSSPAEALARELEKLSLYWGMGAELG
jgi:hypothetical protein